MLLFQGSCIVLMNSDEHAPLVLNTKGQRITLSCRNFCILFAAILLCF